ncbi:phosphoribosyltransferase family protein [Streptomyces sp. NPDC041068]|uniref:phosphoribosyltransferase family protein n=1 Tax=Streptomyces sp. NPDC041068 TaxID=3155130 RepID=UPI00340C1E4B
MTESPVTQEPAGPPGMREPVGRALAPEAVGRSGAREPVGRSGAQESAGPSGTQEPAGPPGMREPVERALAPEVVGRSGARESVGEPDVRESVGEPGAPESDRQSGAAREPDGRPGMWSRQGPYLLDWNSFGTLLDDLADAIRADGFVPDTVLAVARGGLTPAGHLTCALDVPAMHTIRVRRTKDDSRYADKQRPVVEGAGPMPGGRVLVVDDIVGTGATADAVLEYLAAAGVGPGDVRFAAVVRNHQSSYVPDYCPAVIDDWIVFPWETARESTADCRPFPAELRVRT